MSRHTANQLSSRETECLTLAAQGKTYNEIGAILGLSFASIKSYLDCSRYKLHASNVTHAVAIAISLGLIDLGEDPMPRFPSIEPNPSWAKA